MLRFFNSFKYAFRGIMVALKEQQNLKVQLTLAVLAVGLGVYFNITNGEWIALFITIGLVLGFELMNSAIEEIVNLVTKEQNPLVGKIKDIAAGAVLIVSIMALIIGISIFAKYLFYYFRYDYLICQTLDV